MNDNKNSSNYSKNLKSDALFKSIMSEPLAAKEMLEEYLPNNIKELINIDTVKVEPESYVEESLKRKLSDIVYSVKSFENSKKAFIYVLCEHQSTNDSLIALRLWKYTLLLCERHTKDKAGKFPLVFPMVIHTGSKKFTAPMNLWELFSTPYLAKEILTNDFKLVDLQATPDDEIIRKQHIALVEFVMKHIKTRDILKLWEDIFKLLTPAIEIDRNQDFFYIKRLLWYSDAKLDEKKQDDLNNIIIKNLSENEEGKNIMRTIAEKYIDEGIEKGIPLGEARGVEKTAINMLKQNTDPKFVASVTGLSIDDILKLKNSL